MLKWSLTFFVTFVSFQTVPAQTIPSNIGELEACLTEKSVAEIYRACISTVTTAREKHDKLENAEKAEEARIGKAVSDKLYDQRIERQKPYGYAMGMAYGRLALLTKATAKKTDASVCFITAKSLYWLGQEFRQTHAQYSDFKKKLQTVQKTCLQHARNKKREWGDVPDTGDLLSDIPDLKTCLGPLSKPAVYDRVYDCERADNDVQGLIARAMSYRDQKRFAVLGRELQPPRTSWQDLYVTRAKIAFKQSQYNRVIDPGNFKDICMQLKSGESYLDRAEIMPENGSQLDHFQQEVRNGAAKCKMMGY